MRAAAAAAYESSPHKGCTLLLQPETSAPALCFRQNRPNSGQNRPKMVDFILKLYGGFIDLLTSSEDCCPVGSERRGRVISDVRGRCLAYRTSDVRLDRSARVVAVASNLSGMSHYIAL